jgi:5'-nucleotidase
MQRRSFIKKLGIGAGLLSLGSFPFQSLAADDNAQLRILHTNDLHIGLQQNNWDALRAVVDKRAGTLLFDAGDMFHGDGVMTHEEMCAVIRSMSYDAVTIGAHDLDMGIDALADRMKQASFPALVANYDLSRTALAGLVKPYYVFNRGDLKIGVFGIGTDLNGLVAQDVADAIIYHDPITTALRISAFLKYTENCDMVICLSRLGYQHTEEKISDQILAAESTYLDLIIGGHTHTFLAEPALVLNKIGKKVAITQMGWGGTKMGCLNYRFDSKKSSKLFNAQSVIASKQTSAV